MSNFTKWKERYDKYWATKDQLKMLVNLQVLSREEYEDITNQPFDQNED